MPKILLVEDDAMLGPALVDLLQEEQYDVTLATDGASAVQFTQDGVYDVVVLDVMLPEMDGFSVVKQLRKDKNLIPVLMLTARDSVHDRVHGLDVGADDYLVKPFATTELLARVRALLRRLGGEFEDPDVVTLGAISFHTAARELMVGDEVSVLPPKEAVLLELLLRHRGQVLTRSQLMDRIWGFEGDVLENTLETYISKLRKRLECDGCPIIQTVRGLGYRLQING